MLTLDGAIRIDPLFFHTPPDKATSWLGSKLPGLSLEMAEPVRTGGGAVKSYSGYRTWTVRAGQALTAPPALFSRESNTDVICNLLETHQQVSEDGRKEGNTAMADFQSPGVSRLWHSPVRDEKRPP